MVILTLKNDSSLVNLWKLDSINKLDLDQFKTKSETHEETMLYMTAYLAIENWHKHRLQQRRKCYQI